MELNLPEIAKDLSKVPVVRTVAGALVAGSGCKLSLSGGREVCFASVTRQHEAYSDESTKMASWVMLAVICSLPENVFLELSAA
jgi:hypothetical protein